MRLIWTKHAKDNLGAIVSYIWTDNPTAARKIRAKIESLAINLSHQPFLGRPGAIAGTREAIPHPSFRLVYEVGDDAVTILAIVHTARQWPPFEGEAD